MTEKPLAVIRASGGRRMLGVGVMWGLALLLAWMGVAQDFDRPFYQGLMLILAGLALWGGERLRRATQREIWLTETDLRDSSGAVIARLADVEMVDRGAFAFKPSNGFMLRLRAADSRAWHPGLWWRMGRRVGVGGVTSAGQSKAVAELIQQALLTRDAGGEIPGEC